MSLPAQSSDRARFLDQRTALQKVADAAAYSANNYIRVDDVGGQVRVMVETRADWFAWLEVLGGSADAATRHRSWGLPRLWQWRWISSDGNIVVHYVTDAP